MANGNGGVLAFLREYWWQVGLVVLAIFGWVVRVEAAVGKLETIERYQRITEGLGRLQCQRELTNAQMAGIPCGDLLNDWRTR